MTSSPLLEVHDLCVRFDHPAGSIEAVTGVTFDVGAGDPVAIVGGSGSGKSVASLAVLGLLGPGRVAGGSVTWRGEELVGAAPERMRALRGRRPAPAGDADRLPLPPALPRGRAPLRHGRARAGRPRAGPRQPLLVHEEPAAPVAVTVSGAR